MVFSQHRLVLGTQWTRPCRILSFCSSIYQIHPLEETGALLMKYVLWTGNTAAIRRPAVECYRILVNWR